MTPITNEQDLQNTERRWAGIVLGAVAVIIAVICVSSFVMVLHPPSHVETIDPAALSQSKEFAENNLGTRVNPDGSVVVRIIAAQFAFVPRCIPVPQGKPVTIRVTSPDVIHGFLIAGTNANTMVVPGYVAEVRTVFNTAGEHLMPCHEFCGLGHSEMWSVVRVIPQAQWHTDAEGKAACDLSR
jgi:cytochrome c oxidase subunit II